MLQNSTGSINQFLQNKSYRNTFSHSIKYINSSNDKKPYFNKTLFNNAQEKISPKIEFEQDKRLLTSYNERFSGKNKSKIFSSIDNRINRSTDNFPKIILTKRGIKQLSNNAFDTSEYIRDYNKTETNVIRRARSGYYVIQTNEEPGIGFNNTNNSFRIRSTRKIIQESSSLPLFHDKLYDTYGKDKKDNKEKARYSRRNTNNTKIDNDKLNNNRNKKEYNIRHIIKNSSFNDELNNHNHPHRNRSTINHSTRVNDNKKGISLENKRLYRHYFSNSIDENPDNNNKNKENHSYFQKTDIKIKKEEMREEHKRENIINKKNNLMLYEDSSNLRKINVVTPKNDNKKIEESNLINKIRILNNQNNHVLYESINLKKEKPLINSKQNLIKVKIINSYENRSIKNIINFRNSKKITKISKVENNKIDKIKDIKDKVMNTMNKKSSNDLKKEPSDSDKHKSGFNKYINSNNDVVVFKKNSSDTVTNHNIQLKNFERRNIDIKIDKNFTESIETKNSIKKIIKNDDPISNNKENNGKKNNEEKNEKKEKEKGKETYLSQSNINKILKGSTEGSKTNQKKKIKIVNRFKEKDDKINNKKIILEICKASEVTFKGNKKNKEISQNNTNNSNIIIIINNPEQKKIKTIVKSPRNNNNKNNNINFCFNFLFFIFVFIIIFI